ncbi:four and a half LIM domains protein 2-like isoform X2 [Acropora millepora]|uniref:four and a half LIM domains protein 2-like isoform X2 n=1 Tax=Acropora millepora TaxID=45264 RepID=UPI001CF13F4C|nr:four and a half LIM domains protein 2-like isoform X2 [Acropora millepora]
MKADIRKYCIFCKCAVECHDIPQNSSYQNLPEDRMCVEEKPPRSSLQKVKEAHIEGYEWIPAGLSGTQIEDFMSRLPKDKIPRLDSQGAMYRLKELVYQMPLQDFSSKHCRKLPLEQKMVMDDMCITRINKALGVGAVKPGLTVPSTCERCGIPMNVGDMAVFAFHAGPDLCWHVECFVCSNDGGLLVDHVYCWDSDERKLFCPRHWNECLKPRCAGCEELIYVGEYSRAMDAHWHPGHLCCFNCDESLSQQKFIIVENEPSCIKCYERNFANSCQNCGSSIGPGMKDVDVRGKHWHEDCFVCSECKKALLHQGFTFKDEKLICNPCRGISPSKVCDGCGMDFAPGEKKVGYERRTYHEKCFICDDCKQPIGTQQFIKKDGKRLCEKCFDSGYARICVKCNNPIKSSIVKHDEKPFHPECFACSICSKPLAGKPFTKHEGRNVCQDCYRSNYAKRCATCNELIEGSVKFVTYDDKFFHRDCFTCAKCGRTLAGEKFCIMKGDKVCMNCHAKIKM